MTGTQFWSEELDQNEKVQRRMKKYNGETSRDENYQEYKNKETTGSAQFKFISVAFEDNCKHCLLQALMFYKKKTQ